MEDAPTQLSQPRGPTQGKQKRKRTTIDAAHRPGAVRNGLGFAFPQKYTAKLLYFDHFNTTVDAAFYNKEFNANSLYDPDSNGTGHQPRGFDQLCSSSGPYRRYMVTNCKLEAWPTTDIPGVVGCVVANESMTALPLLTLGESNGNLKFDYAPSIAYGGHKKLTVNVKPWEVVGVSKKEYLSDWDRFGAAYNADPTEVIRILLQWNSHDLSTQFANFNMFVRITYTAEFSDAALLSAS